MVEKPPSFADLAHQVVQESPEPLVFKEIVARVHALRPITTKNPKSTIRHIVTQSRLITATGEGTYGWLPRLINGSVLRLTLSETDLRGEGISWSDEVRDALWPGFFETQKRSDREPVNVELPVNAKPSGGTELPGGEWTRLPLDFIPGRRWGTKGSPAFNEWLDDKKTMPGDHLIFQVLDGEARNYRVTFEARRDRDEAAIAERNRSILSDAEAFHSRRAHGTAIWELTSHLLATGQYRHPIPPDPLSEIWQDDYREPGQAIENSGSRASRKDPQLMQILERFFDQSPDNLEGISFESYDVENPQDLPREYNPDFGRRPRESAKAAKGLVKTYRLKVNHRWHPATWREIEIAEDQTLEDLHLTIQAAFGWFDDHLYSFFMSGKAWDQAAEIGSPWSESDWHTHQVTIESLGLEEGQEFLYLFDYGDSHEFDVKVTGTNPKAPRGKYPKIVQARGPAPEQYPEYDEE